MKINAKINITIFNAEGLEKFPRSPFNDNTFIFETLQISFKQLPHIFAYNYHLNRNYNIHSKRLQRTKRTLKEYLSNKIEYIVLDIDNVHSYENVEKIINILKNENYHFFLMPSRSYGKEYNKFNLKGAIRVKGYNNEQGIIQFLKVLNDKINGYGDIDLSVAREATFQAPTLRDEILIFNEGDNIPVIQKIEKQNISISNLSNLSNSEILQEAINYLRTLGFIPVQDKGNLIVFEHPNEKTKRGYFMFKNNPFILHHFDKSKSKNIYKDLLQYNTRLKEKIRKENIIRSQHKLEKIFKQDLINIISVNKKFLDKDIYNRLDTEKNLLIQSPMGTAKSQIIFEYLKEHNEKVLFITNRRSLAKDMSQKYNIKIYLEDEWEIGESLIVQFDSLHKYDLRHFDTIIIDEYVSVLLHSLSNLNSNFIISKLKLFKALTGKHKVILLDAFLNIAPIYAKNINFNEKLIKVQEICQKPEKLNIFEKTGTSWSEGFQQYQVGQKDQKLSNLTRKASFVSTDQERPESDQVDQIDQFKSFSNSLTSFEKNEQKTEVNCNFMSIVNNYRENVKLFEYTNEMKIIQQILNETEKFTLSISNKQLAETIYEILKNKGKKVILLSSETTDEEKNIIYKSFEKEHVTWDCLIYTPTLTVGVSIIADNIKKHYHIDEGNIDVISSLQMIKRNRKAEEIHFYVKEIKKNYIINRDLLKDFYLQNASEGPIFSYDEYGNLQLNQFGEFIIDIQIFSNMLELNHYYSFKKLLEMQFTMDIITINESCKLNLTEWKRKIKQKRSNNINKFIKKFLENDLLHGSDEEKILALQKLFRTEDKEIIALAIKHEKEIEKLKLHKLFLKNKKYIENYYKKLIAEGYDYQYIKKLQILLYWKNKIKELKQRYVKKEIKEYGDEFKQFLRMIGYKWKYNSYYFDDELKMLLEHLS